MKFRQIYHPWTANPFSMDDTYREYEPCDALKPYIRCFWGSSKPYWQKAEDFGKHSVVIPDTCMDIIFDINFTENHIDDCFCGIDDAAFVTGGKVESPCHVSTFAIRFYAWGVAPFAEDSMKNVKNGFFDTEAYFSRLKKELMPILFDVTDMGERIALTQRILLKYLRPERNNRLVNEAVGEILTAKGNLRMEELARQIHVSSRQIERVFRENMGISPKQLSSLIRYQYLWNMALFSKNFHVQDAVYELGYADQAHLMNDFKKYHTMTLREAVNKARADVAFFQ